MQARMLSIGRPVAGITKRGWVGQNGDGRGRTKPGTAAGRLRCPVMWAHFRACVEGRLT